MEVTAETPRGQFKFKGKTVSVVQPWKPGDTLSDNHAKFVNRSFASIVGNILSSAINRHVDKLKAANDKLPDGDTNKLPADFDYLGTMTDAEAQKMLDAIVANYEPGVTAARGEGIARDPIESIADNIAWEKIKARLTKLNIKVSSVNKDKKSELIDQMHTLDPSIMAEAKRIYEGNTTDEGVDKLLAGLAPAADAATPGASDGGQTNVTNNDTQSGTDTAQPNDANTVSGGQGADTVSGTEGGAPITDAQTHVEPGQGTAPDVVKDGDAAAPGAAVPAVEAGEAPSPVDNPGNVEVAPDAGAGEVTPPKGAFS